MNRVKQLAYQADLPPSRNAAKPTNPFTAGAMVGIRYTNAEGVEWAGPCKIHVASFDSDGVIHGTFDQVTPPHTDKERTDITLTGGIFSARISSPW